MIVRAEIIVSGLVQGVGYRYFVLRAAAQIGGIAGYTKNLYNGDVLTVAEGEKHLIENLFERLRTGPMHAQVRNAKIEWSDAKNEFNTFEIRQ